MIRKPESSSGNRDTGPIIAVVKDHQKKSTNPVVYRTFYFRVSKRQNHRMTQHRQYRCRDAPALGGGVTGAKYACTFIFGR